MGATRKQQIKASATESYEKLRSIDGTHPYKAAVPGGYVDYQARQRRGGKVSYFNFELAVEMGLVPASHPRKMTKELRKAVLDTFAIQIINEYDMINGTKFPPKDVKPHKFMATRYLQLQHPDKTGTTSGDGRSVWNGVVTHDGVTWDVSSCGTGATSLSPATAIEKRFFQTGDPEVCYGCGHADLTAGIGAAIFSEILHRSGVPTERTLAVIGFEGGLAINVRAGKNLLRPSHFFLYLRQGNYAALKAAVDFFVARQIGNGEPGYLAPARQRYQAFAETMAINFARSAAIFESHYVFVWMDWDGDNILADGGIIDYGSVRQFGLFHSEYRYDDVDRMSTALLEQRAKARQMVQTFAQLRDFLLTGERKKRNAFNRDAIVKLFDLTFEETLLEQLLERTGFDAHQTEYLMRYHRPMVERFRAVHASFERAKSTRGPYKVADGITWDAVYCMRAVLRELPKHLLEHEARPTQREFMTMMASSLAKKKDRALSPAKARKIQLYLKHYEELIASVAKHEQKSLKKALLKLVMRSAHLNREDRATGNAVLLMADKLSKESARFQSDELQSLIEAVIAQQDAEATIEVEVRGGDRVQTVAKACLRLLKDYKDSI